MTVERDIRVKAAFSRSLRRSRYAHLMDTVARRDGSLLTLQEARQTLSPTGRRYRGIMTVPIDQIVGTTDRVRDFDRAFRPKQAYVGKRWQSVAVAMEAGYGLPPIQVYQLGQHYFVQDGHHRVSVARARGQEFIDAEVIEESVTISPRPSDNCRGTWSSRRSPLRSWRTELSRRWRTGQEQLSSKVAGNVARQGPCLSG